MKIPEQIRIMFKEYTITEKEDLHEGAATLYGHANNLRQEILLNAEASEAQKIETILHEAIHAIDDIMDIGLEEEQVARLGAGLYMLFADNPEVFQE